MNVEITSGWSHVQSHRQENIKVLKKLSNAREDWNMESLDIGTGEMLLQLISAPKTNAVVKNIIAATTHYHTYYVTRLQLLPHLRSDPSCRLHPTSFFILSPLRRPPIVSSSGRHWSNASPQLPGNNHISTPSHPPRFDHPLPVPPPASRPAARKS